MLFEHFWLFIFTFHLSKASYSYYFSLLGQTQKRMLITNANAKSKSEKFPPPHQDGALGFPLGCSHYGDPAFDPRDASFSIGFPDQKGTALTWSGPFLKNIGTNNPKRKKQMDRNVRHSSKFHEGI